MVYDYKLLFTALVAQRVAGPPRPGAVRISWAEYENAREHLDLVEWPVVEATYDFGVKVRG